MDWGELGEKIASTGATLLGGAVGGPMGASLAGMVTEALGIESTDPEEIARAIGQDPKAAVKLKTIQSQERIRLQELASKQAIAKIDAQAKEQAEINKTMRQEVKAEGTYKSGWRPFIGWIFGASAGALIASLIYAIGKDPTVVSNPEFTGLLVWIFTAMATILGVNIGARSRDKRIQQGLPDSGMIERIRGALGNSGKGAGQ